MAAGRRAQHLEKQTGSSKRIQGMKYAHDGISLAPSCTQWLASHSPWHLDASVVFYRRLGSRRLLSTGTQSCHVSCSFSGTWNILTGPISCLSARGAGSGGRGTTSQIEFTTVYFGWTPATETSTTHGYIYQISHTKTRHPAIRNRSRFPD